MFKSFDLSMVLNGILGGLVGITAGADSVSILSSIAIGFIAGMLIPLSVTFIDRLKLDDPVGATSVHLTCGIWGTLAVGIFGQFDDPNTGQFIDQLIGVLAIGAFTFTFAFIIFFLLKATVGIRVHDEEELAGLDLGEHQLLAYS